MPCRDEYYDSRSVSSLHKAEDTISQLRAENGMLTAMLCGVLHSAEALGFDREIFHTFNEARSGVFVRELRAWWKNHQKRDKRRGPSRD